jgi:hypothetical protein
VTPELVAHARALVLDGRCPACAEPMPPLGLFRGRPCTRCGESPASFRIGAHEIAGAVARRSNKHVVIVAGIVAAAHLLLGWVPLTGALALLAAAIWIRFGILVPATRVMSPTRGMLTRWTARLIVGVLVAFTVVFSEALTLIGPLGLPVKAVLGAGEVVIAALGVSAYVNWQVRREAAGTPVEAWEWAILGGALIMLGLAAAGLALATVFIATALSELAKGLVG